MILCYLNHSSPSFWDIKQICVKLIVSSTGILPSSCLVGVWNSLKQYSLWHINIHTINDDETCPYCQCCQCNRFIGLIWAGSGQGSEIQSFGDVSWTSGLRIPKAAAPIRLHHWAFCLSNLFRRCQVDISEGKKIKTQCAQQ